MQASEEGKLVVISGPSGSGKTTICKELVSLPRVTFSVSATTRPKRDGEQEGEDYFFYSEDEFSRGVESGAFLEWARYNGRSYGTPRLPVEKAKAGGAVVVLEIEVQGAEKLREASEEGQYLFIEPPSMEVLEERLRGRGTESDQEVRNRLAIAMGEWTKARDSRIYDHFVKNDKLTRAVGEIKDLLGL